MTTFRTFSLSALCALAALTAKADNLWIAGDATPSGWDLDRATALLSTPADAKVYTGTVYLVADQEFKFMTVPDWGNTELGAAPGAVLENGTVALAEGTLDSGYDKLKVAEDGNYFISVDRSSLTARIEKSEYQESQISLCSLYLVGSATAGGWDVMSGTPLYHNDAEPFIYSAAGLELGEGSFKIATTLKGASTWNEAYWYFRDADNAAKIALGQSGDLQWEIADAGKYTVTVNTIDNAISIIKDSETGITYQVNADGGVTPRYFDIHGMEVKNPTAGMYIRLTGDKAEKIILK